MSRWGPLSTSGRRSRGEAAPASLKILAVEDSASARKVFQTVLIRLGVPLHDVRLAADAAEAQQLFQQWQPDLVFVDVELRSSAGRPPPAPSEGGNGGKAGPIDGDGLAQWLLERDPDLRLVVVTAYDRDHPRVRALLAHGVADVIVKPVMASQVQAILQRISAERGGGRPK
ncbi:MAG TPA: response regulator [Thermoplasmata archaeon]|nr:response regulator [Thermoplasmata archaeon]